MSQKRKIAITGNIDAAFAGQLDQPSFFSLLRQLDVTYHNGTKPPVSDADYDHLRDKYNTQFKNHPYTKIGAAADDDEPKRAKKSKKPPKVKLPYPMASLAKVVTAEELSKFLDRFNDEDWFHITDKLDGMSGGIYYTMHANRRPELTTRYNGIKGRIKTHLLDHIEGGVAAKKLESAQHFDFVRGEMLLSRSNWDVVQKLQPTLIAARNALAGIVNREDSFNPKIAAHIHYVAYEAISRNGTKWSPKQQFEAMSSHEFRTPWFKMVQKKEMTHDFMSKLHDQRMAESDYEIDGIVVRFNKEGEQEIPMLDGEDEQDDEEDDEDEEDNEDEEDDGLEDTRLKNPKNAFAFKVQEPTVDSIVTKVTWQISKHRLMKPRVWFNPVKCGNVTVEKATGHNAKYIFDHKIGPGSPVKVRRRGRVIPYVEEAGPSTSGEPQMPDEDQYDYVWNESKVDLIVVGSEMEAGLRKVVEFFKALEVKNIGPANAALLYKHFDGSLARILSATKAELAKIDRYQTKSVENIYATLQKLKQPLLPVRVMAASAIFGHGFGVRKCNLILQNLPDVLQWNQTEKAAATKQQRIADLEKLTAIDGIGVKTAEQFYDSLPVFRNFLKEHPTIQLIQQQPLPAQAVAEAAKVPISLVVCFTGITKKHWHASLEAKGIRVSDNFTKQVKLVIVADINSTSSTAKKARKDGIKIVTVQDFATEHGLPL